MNRANGEKTQHLFQIPIFSHLNTATYLAIRTCAKKPASLCGRREAEQVKQARLSEHGLDPHPKRRLCLPGYLEGNRLAKQGGFIPG
jgi:hypothetical protein